MRVYDIDDRTAEAIQCTVGAGVDLRGSYSYPAESMKPSEPPCKAHLMRVGIH